MDIGYKKGEIGTFATIATLATALFPKSPIFHDDLTAFLFDPGSAKILLCHFGYGLVPERCDELNRLLGIRMHEDPR